MTIDASMLAEGITIDASGNDDTPSVDDQDGTSVFRIEVVVGFSEIKEVALKNLTLTGGDTGAGGAIFFRSTDWRNEIGHVVLSVEDCTIEDNHASDGGGLWAEFGVVNLTRSIVADNRAFGHGGGVHLHEGIRSASLTASQLLRNQAGNQGGGLWGNLGREGNSYITLDDCLVAENKITEFFVGGHESGAGGGLYVDLHGEESIPELNIINSQLILNEATGDGGGAYVVSKFPAEVNVVNSSVIENMAGSEAASENQVGRGGGLWLSNDPFAEEGHLTANILQTTISGNSALLQGGGLWLGITFDLLSSDWGAVETFLDFVTISENRSAAGGGLFSDTSLGNVSTTLKHTIVSGNKKLLPSNDPDNVAGAIELTSSYNLLGTSTATRPTTASPLFNIHSDAHGLRPLADNGGPRLPNGDPMLTHQPMHTSPAVDAGDPLIAFDVDDFDQRGPNFFRVFNQPNKSGGPVDIGAIELGAARVLDVTIKGLSSTHDPFSFAEGTFQGEPMTGGGNQLRTVPVGGADIVEIRFSEEMPITGTGAIVANSLSLIGLSSGTTLTTPNFAYDDDTFTATWTFTSPLPADMYVISIPDAVTDVGGNQLDGEWTNPFSILTTSADVSRFPSGDGDGGGDFAFVMTILPGDANLDNHVDSTDFLIYQQNVSQTDPTFQQADFNGDGATNSADLALLNASPFSLAFLVYADFNGDGVVNGLDYSIFLSNYGNTNATHAQGDASGDGGVFSDDYLLLEQQFGLEIDWVL